MYFDLIYPSLLLSNRDTSNHFLPDLVSSFKNIINIILRNPISAMHIGVRLPTGTQATYQWPHPQRKVTVLSQ